MIMYQPSYPNTTGDLSPLAALFLRGIVVPRIVLPIILPVNAAERGEDCDPAVLQRIKGYTGLRPSCTCRRTIRITDSNTTLNCQGSRFVGPVPEKVGLTIDSQGKPLSNVVVKNCKFNNFLSSGVRVTSGEQDVKKGTNHTEIYRRSPFRIVLDNMSVHNNNGGVGIYLDDYVSNVTVKNSSITRSGGAGVYFKHSSRHIKLIGNKITSNGFRDDIKAKRNGVAVDSAANNLIERNVFQGNAVGGASTRAAANISIQESM